MSAPYKNPLTKLIWFPLYADIVGPIWPLSMKVTLYCDWGNEYPLSVTGVCSHASPLAVRASG